MGKSFKERTQSLKESLLDREKYFRVVKSATYLILIFVGAIMTVMNILTPEIGYNNGIDSLLTYTTGAFTILSLFCFLLSLAGKGASKVSAAIFAIGIIGMFAIFLYSGQPEGFSAIWICLTPIATMVFFGRNKGTIFSAVMFVILILFLWIDVFKYIPHLNMYNGYTATFKKRFPILYLSFAAVTFLLETIQDYQFDVLDKVNNINKRYSTHDQLTGLFNRKGFYDDLEKQLKQRTYSKIGFIIFDLDHFKKLNDTYGHLAGDEVLIEFANIIKDCLPRTITCRWGGEEFLISYFDDDVNKADLENLRVAVQEHMFISDNKVMRTTCSGGVFETSDKNYSNRAMWLKNADAALYKAKESGRNKIVYF